MKKFRSIAKATRTLVNMSSFERSESSAAVNAKKAAAAAAAASSAAVIEEEDRTARVKSLSCNQLPSVSEPLDRTTGGSIRSLDGSARLKSICAGSAEQLKEAQAPAVLEMDDKFPVYEVVDVDEIVMPTTAASGEQRTGGPAKQPDGTSSEKSLALSGNDEMPDEPPDCFPTSLQQRCLGCYSTDDSGVCHLWRMLRSGLLTLVKHPAFEWSILILIFGSSITLCFEDIYLEENPRLMEILRWINLIFAILFALEMVIKWFALGIKYYFSSMWSTLDFIIVMVSLVSVAVEDSANLSALRSLRTLRALRPLRAISRWQGMKIVVNALMFAIPAIFNVLLVCLVFWLVFSILGVQLFGGKFYKCVDYETGARFSHLVSRQLDKKQIGSASKKKPLDTHRSSTRRRTASAAI